MRAGKINFIVLSHGALIAVLLLSGFPVATFAAAPLVGLLGDPQRIEFVGARFYSIEAMRDAVREDVPTQIAATPSAPLPEYLATLQDRLSFGYARQGFPKAKVAAQVNKAGDGVTVLIEEGERFNAAQVLLEGQTKGIDAGPIVAALTKKRIRPKNNAQHRGDDVVVIPTLEVEEEVEAREALWSAGEPASSGATFDAQVAAEVRRELDVQGYFWAKFSIHRREQGQRVDLIIRIDDLGRQAMIHQWTIAGGRRNSADDVAAYLGLKQDQPVNLAGLRAIHRKLWDSGCFLQHDVQLSRWVDLQGMAALRIDLREPQRGRRLDEPLTPAERVMLKFGRWVMKDAGVEEDAKAQLPAAGGTLHLTANRRDGAVFRFHHGMGDVPVKRDFISIAATSNSAGIFSSLTGRSLVADRVEASITPSLEMVPDPAGKPRPDGTLTENSVIVGAFIESVDEATGKTPGIHWRITIAPVTLLNLIRDKDVKVDLAGGELTIRTAAAVWRIKESTGQLLEYRGKQDDQTLGDVVVTFEKGALQRELKELGQTAPANIFDKQRPIASVASYLAHAAVVYRLAGEDEATRLAAADAAAKVLSPAALELLDPARDGKRGDGRQFKIPLEFRSMQDAVLRIAPMATQLFEHGSWPWTLTRQALFAAAGNTRYLREETSRLYADETMGPVGCLLAAQAAALVSDDLSRLFARLGQSRLNADAFVGDLKVLLGGDKPAAAMLAGIARNFQQLSEEEVKALAVLVDEGHRPALVEFWKAIQPAGGKQLDGDAMEKLQRAWWERAGRDMVERRLKAMAVATPQAAD